MESYEWLLILYSRKANKSINSHTRDDGRIKPRPVQLKLINLFLLIYFFSLTKTQPNLILNSEHRGQKRRD